MRLEPAPEDGDLDTARVAALAADFKVDDQGQLPDLHASTDRAASQEVLKELLEMGIEGHGVRSTSGGLLILECYYRLASMY